MRKKGSITVYLALIFMVVFMLIMAIVSLLRYEGEKTNAKRTLDISVESAFSKYYKPLLDDYDLLYYIEPDEMTLSADTMTYYLKNQMLTHPWLRTVPGSLDVENKKYAVDDKCSNVKEQMVKAGHYMAGEMVVDKLKEEIASFLEMTEDNEKALEEVTKDIDSSKDKAVHESEILELLGMIDGARISGKSMEVNDHFVKEGLKGDVKQINAGIDSVDVWSKVKDSCFDMSVPGDDFNGWLQRIKGIKTVTDKAFNLCQKLDNEMTSDEKNDAICDVSSIKKKLSDNKMILENLINLSEGDDIEALLEDYHVKDITFDYSGYHPEDVKDPTSLIDMNDSGVLNLIIGEGAEISNKSISEAGIYENAATEGEDKGSFLDYRNIQEIGNVLSNLTFKSVLKGVDETVFLTLYMEGYFNSFTDDISDSEADKKALLYEQEYILCGKESDEANLKKLVNELLLVRTGENFIFFLTDNDSKNKAYATAAALVGFTGMDAIVRVTQYIILAGWAYAEACVDVSGLLNGKKISLLKNKDNMNISFQELLLFGPELVKNKVSKMNNKSGITYEQCLWFMVGIMGKNKCVFRAMDLIHYNMKLNHEKSFSFTKALYGAEFSLVVMSPFEYSCRTKFKY